MPLKFGAINFKKYIDTLSEYCYNMITDILSE